MRNLFLRQECSFDVYGPERGLLVSCSGQCSLAFSEWDWEMMCNNSKRRKARNRSSTRARSALANSGKHLTRSYRVKHFRVSTTARGFHKIWLRKLEWRVLELVFRCQNAFPATADIQNPIVTQTPHAHRLRREINSINYPWLLLIPLVRQSCQAIFRVERGENCFIASRFLTRFSSFHDFAFIVYFERLIPWKWISPNAEDIKTLSGFVYTKKNISVEDFWCESDPEIFQIVMIISAFWGFLSARPHRDFLDRILINTQSELLRWSNKINTRRASTKWGDNAEQISRGILKTSLDYHWKLHNVSPSREIINNSRVVRSVINRRPAN